MRITLLGGLAVEHDGRPIVVSGAMQLAVLFRLAVDAGRAVSVRSIVEDVWGVDAPENEKAALQSVISRLRSQLPAGVIESSVGGYRLVMSRDDVDALVFGDRVAAASSASGPEAARLASQALALWAGEPWIPSDNFDWFESDLRRDRATALELGGVAETRSARSGVPAPLTSLIGRETELAMIADQLAASRLVTIVGTGGAGKTRLAIETARALPHALLVELAPVASGEVLSAVLAAAGRELRTEKIVDPTKTLDRVIETLFGRELLMVLDNCEHVIGEAASVAEQLLGALPQLRILATSREPLSIAGEAFVAVGSLSHAPAVELFRQRAAAAQGHELDDLDVAGQICARLDGLPLALELAAARLRTMSLDEVLSGLEHRFTLLTGGYRTALPRHQTLRAMIDWSWSLLGDDERTALSHLAVFPAGVSAADAADFTAAIGVSSDAVLDALVDRSLLQRTRGRYRTLETIREYGIEKLAELGASGPAREVQARLVAGGARLADARMRGPQIRGAIAWFDAEEDNISAALRFATSAPLPHIAVQLATSCAWYWIIRERQDDARIWFPLATALAAEVDGPEAELMALIAPVAAVMTGGGRPEQPGPPQLFAEQLEQLAPLADVHIGAGAHHLLQLIPPLVGSFSAVASRPDWMTAVRLPAGEGLGLDEWPTAVLHVARAAMAQNRGDITELGTESQLAVQQFEQIGDLWGLALSKQMRAEWLILESRLAEALAMTDAATENLRSITPSDDLAQQQGQGISVLLRLGRVDDARDRASRFLDEARASGNSRAVLQALITATLVDLQARDLAAADAKLVSITELTEAWPGSPTQLAAMAGTVLAGAELLRGDLDAAEAHLRVAATAAVDSHDQPVIGNVAIAVGSLALARGDIPSALRAVDLGTQFIGIYDASNPQVVAIEQAAINAGIGRTNADALTHPMAVKALQELVGD